MTYNVTWTYTLETTSTMFQLFEPHSPVRHASVYSLYMAAATAGQDYHPEKKPSSKGCAAVQDTAICNNYGLAWLICGL